MPTVNYTRNLQRHVECPAVEVPGRTVREVLDAAFELNPRVRDYVVDEQGALRRHMAVFINGRQILDPAHLSDAVAEEDEIYVIQALSGG